MAALADDLPDEPEKGIAVVPCNRTLRAVLEDRPSRSAKEFAAELGR